MTSEEETPPENEENTHQQKPAPNENEEETMS